LVPRGRSGRTRADQKDRNNLDGTLSIKKCTVCYFFATPAPPGNCRHQRRHENTEMRGFTQSELTQMPVASRVDIP